MTRNAAALIREALDLDDSERAEVAVALLDSLDGDASAESPEAVERAWQEEIRRRIAAVDAGEAKLVPWEEVRAGLVGRSGGLTA